MTERRQVNMSLTLGEYEMLRRRSDGRGIGAVALDLLRETLHQASPQKPPPPRPPMPPAPPLPPPVPARVASWQHPTGTYEQYIAREEIRTLPNHADIQRALDANGSALTEIMSLLQAQVIAIKAIDEWLQIMAPSGKPQREMARGRAEAAIRSWRG